MTTSRTELVKALAEDEDHMIASGENLDWLAAQLACWPTRVHPERTTSDRFLRLSAAATLSQQADLIEKLTALVAAVDRWRDDPDVAAEQAILDARDAIGFTLSTLPDTMRDERTDKTSIDDLAYSVANAKLGEGPSVRCEGPTPFEIDLAREWVRRVLQAQRRATESGEHLKDRGEA